MGKKYVIRKEGDTFIASKAPTPSLRERISGGFRSGLVKLGDKERQLGSRVVQNVKERAREEWERRKEIALVRKQANRAETLRQVGLQERRKVASQYAQRQQGGEGLLGGLGGLGSSILSGGISHDILGLGDLRGSSQRRTPQRRAPAKHGKKRR